MTTFSPIATGPSSLGITPAVQAPAAQTPAVQAPAAGAQPAAAGNAAVATGYDATPVDTSVAGGGAVLDAINKGIQDFGSLTGISRMVAQSSSRVENVNKQMQARMTATGGQLSAGEMQIFSQQMSLAETVMQMAKSIQDKQDQINQIWARG